MIRSITLAATLSLCAMAASADLAAPSALPSSEAQVLAEVQAHAAEIRRNIELLRLKIAMIAASTPQ